MEREILFRAKRKDNGEWVQGMPFLYNDRVFIVGPLVELNDEYCAPEYWWRVNPDTVGQYTGLTDKNGAKIFEGDVVSTPEFMYEVCFIDGVFEAYHYGTVLHGRLSGTLRELLAYPRFQVEVIGNIHDNASLLNQ